MSICVCVWTHFPFRLLCPLVRARLAFSTLPALWLSLCLSLLFENFPKSGLGLALPPLPPTPAPRRRPREVGGGGASASGAAGRRGPGGGALASCEGSSPARRRPLSPPRPAPFGARARGVRGRLPGLSRPGPGAGGGTPLPGYRGGASLRQLPPSPPPRPLPRLLLIPPPPPPSTPLAAAASSSPRLPPPAAELWVGAAAGPRPRQ